MSAPYAAIRSALSARLQAYTPAQSIAWENVPFTPAVGVTYLKPALIPGEPFQAELGADGLNRHTGIYQVSIYAPAGGGMGSILTLQNGIVDHFRRGMKLTYSGVTVRIDKSYAGTMQTETDRVHIPITIQYTAMAPP